MEGLTIESTNKKLVLSIDKENFSESVLLKILKVARLEYLIEKAGFSDELLQFDEEMKDAWWGENKAAIFAKAKA
jgi:hypothetical protein